MKKRLLGVLAIGALFSLNTTVQAQDTTTAGQDIKNAAKKTGKAVKKTAKKVGNKTAELASKGSSAVVDKIYEGKQGPNGETIYIDNKSKYYWVDKKGHRVYIAESKLKNKD